MSRTYEQLEPVISALDERIKTNLGAFPTDTASGAVANFVDGADDIPLKSLVVNIDPVQSGSGDPSPDNVRPISGWTGANVVRTGKNLCPRNTMRTSHSGIDYTVTDEGIRVHGTATTSSYSWTSDIDYASTWLKLPAGTYTFSITDMFGTNQSDGYVVFMGWNVDGTDINNFVLHNASKTSTRTFAKDVGLYYGIYIKNGLTVDTVVKIQAELGPATAYESYQDNTYDITFPSEAGTVYGGKLDVLTGELTVYPYYASYNGETLTGRWISDRDVYAVGTTPTIGAQVVNIGAEGTEIQLSPHKVKTLLGQNNIFADTGDSAVEYRADTKLYIERLTEPDADMIADANITSGSYFMVGNTLYKATANIASGSAVIEGTNCTQKSLSEALNEINQ